MFLFEYEEFSRIDIAVLTVFRCFTDGCSASDGTPLQHRLQKDLGFPIFCVYFVCFSWVTIGVFNLIMATFVDSVSDVALKRRREKLDIEREKTRSCIKNEL